MLSFRKIHTLAIKAKKLRQQGKLEEAIDLLQSHLDRRGDRVKPYEEASVLTGLAECYHRQQQPLKAMEHFQRAVTLNPDNAFAHVGLGNLYCETGQTGQAFEHYHEVLQRDPANRYALNGIANILQLLQIKPDSAAAAAPALKQG